MNSELKNSIGIGGSFYLKHYRDGELIDIQMSKNLFTNEGLVYALNTAFGLSIAGKPASKTALYIGLTGANRSWTATDKADDTGGSGIHTVGQEFETYTETARPAWEPLSLSSIADITLDDTGTEATFTIGADVTIYGAFLISTSAKNGSTDDANALLMAGSNFTTPRALLTNDVFKVGYILSAASGS